MLVKWSRIREVSSPIHFTLIRVREVYYLSEEIYMRYYVSFLLGNNSLLGKSNYFKTIRIDLFLFSWERIPNVIPHRGGTRYIQSVICRCEFTGPGTDSYSSRRDEVVRTAATFTLTQPDTHPELWAIWPSVSVKWVYFIVHTTLSFWKSFLYSQSILKVKSTIWCVFEDL